MKIAGHRPGGANLTCTTKLPSRQAKLPGREKLSSTENLDERNCPADQSCQGEQNCQTERRCQAGQSRAERDGPVETSEFARSFLVAVLLVEAIFYLSVLFMTRE